MGEDFQVGDKVLYRDVLKGIVTQKSGYIYSVLMSNGSLFVEIEGYYLAHDNSVVLNIFGEFEE